MWKDANVSDIPADMHTQTMENFSDEKEMSTLRRALRENRKEGALGRKRWPAIQTNRLLFAVQEN